MGLWLVVLAIAMSAVSLYYYLKVLKRIYVADSPDDAVPIRAPIVSQIAICLLALSVVVLGCDPSLLLTRLRNARDSVVMEQGSQKGDRVTTHFQSYLEMALEQE